ncbi:MAG: ATP-binding protein [Bacteroidetes bacterium]|nr:MAG: ATP-binding protein [Bacteroidota bacterium]
MSLSETKELLNRIKLGENQYQDFKFEINDARKIARSLSAFSNTSGGRLLIGVKDNGRISGIRSEEEFYMVESAASRYCKPEIRFESRQHRIESKQVLEIYIPECSDKPVFAKDDNNRWMAYIRVADENHLANIVQLSVWEQANEPLGETLVYDRIQGILLEHLKRHPGQELGRIAKDTGIKRRDLIVDLTKLVRFNVVEMIQEGSRCLFSLSEDQR